jgi:translocation and assembly module TamB
VIPGLIVREIRARYGGEVTIRDWWLGARSAGVVGLVLHEGPAASSPVWARFERVSTDLSLGGLISGRFSPSRIDLYSPQLAFRLDRDGHALTQLPLKAGGGSALPVVTFDDAQVTFHQEGRPEMVISGVKGQLTPEIEGARLAASTDDPTWGHWTAQGHMDGGLRTGQVVLSGSHVAANLNKVARIPYVPEEVWKHVVPDGPVDVALSLALVAGKPSSLQVRTTVGFQNTVMDLPTLGLHTTAATGQIVVEDGVVRLEKLSGQALGGTVSSDGTLDFSRSPLRFDIALDLQQIDVSQTPSSWQLQEIAATGRLTGKARLVVVMNPNGADLTGSSGEAVLEGGTVQGIPVKSLRLTMRADGNDLQYDTSQPSADARGLGVVSLVALQAPAPVAPSTPARAQPVPARGRLRLPKSISTDIELEDVDLGKLVRRVEKLGIRLPVAVAGRLSLKAKAKIPLGSFRDLKGYAFHGDLTLKGAKIAGVDLGRLEARLDLEDGVLALTDFRGRLVDQPGGPIHKTPAPSEPVAAEGPLPPGGFRGRLRAELSPPGPLTASIQGNQLPLGELLEPATHGPPPASGRITLDAEAQGRVDALGDSGAWAVKGRVESVQVRYRGTTLDAVSTAFALKEGHLELPDLEARMGGRPLQAQLKVDLAAPYAFSGHVDLTGWSVPAMLALIPGAPASMPLDGTLTTRAEAAGTLTPWTIRTRGAGRLDQVRVGPLRLGELPFKWSTEGEAILVSVVEAHPLGGKLSAEARVATDAHGSTEGSATWTGLNLDQLTAALPRGGVKLTGKANGRATFVVPAGIDGLQADVHLAAEELTVQGLPAREVHITLAAQHGDLSYRLEADSLGAKVRFHGELPLKASDPSKAVANAELQAAGFTLAAIWPVIGVTGALAELHGRGAIDTNLRMPLRHLALWAHGIAEFRDLTWGRRYPLGHLRGEVIVTPTAWKVEPLDGELLGGPAEGKLWGDTPSKGPRTMGFDLRVDQALLSSALALLPSVARHVEGYGTLRLSGRFDPGLHATAHLNVIRARVFGLPLSEMSVPATLQYAHGSATGQLHLHRWTTRLAGGNVRGDARFHFGADYSFQSEIHVNDVDLETLTRVGTEARRPASGKITGRVLMSGPHPAELRRLKGKVVLDLNDASLVELPVFRELDRFLGAARGGVFEDGDLDATIANGQLVVEQMTLVGRAVQLHATGTVGFNGQLNLEVLVNTNQIISQTGQALVSLIPGLGEVVGRGQEATSRVASFLSNRLLKFRVVGTLRSPSVAIDPAVVVSEAAVGFFGGVLSLPLQLVR